jgi:hypothetical protein
MPGRLDDSEFARTPYAGISDDREVVEEEFGVAALAADACPQREFTPAAQRDAARTDRSGLDFRCPDKVGRAAIRASWCHVLNFPGTR